MNERKQSGDSEDEITFQEMKNMDFYFRPSVIANHVQSMSNQAKTCETSNCNNSVEHNEEFL